MRLGGGKQQPTSHTCKQLARHRSPLGRHTRSAFRPISWAPACAVRLRGRSISSELETPTFLKRGKLRHARSQIGDLLPYTCVGVRAKCRSYLTHLTPTQPPPDPLAFKGLSSTLLPPKHRSLLYGATRQGGAFSAPTLLLLDVAPARALTDAACLRCRCRRQPCQDEGTRTGPANPCCVPQWEASHASPGRASGYRRSWQTCPWPPRRS